MAISRYAVDVSFSLRTYGWLLGAVWLTACASEVPLDPEEHVVSKGEWTLRYQMIEAVAVEQGEVRYTYDVSLENRALQSPSLLLSVTTDDPGIQPPDAPLFIGPVHHGKKTHAEDAILLRREGQTFLDPRALQWTFVAPDEQAGSNPAEGADALAPLGDAEGPAFTAIGEYFLVRFQPTERQLVDDWSEAAFDVEVEATGQLPLSIGVRFAAGESPGRIVSGELSFSGVATGTTATTDDHLVLVSEPDRKPRAEALEVMFTPRFPESTSGLQADCRYPALDLSYGQMGLEPATPASDILISAPHGRYDRNTLPIARMLAEHLSANLLWAYDYRSSTWPIGHFVNVNRPTGGLDMPSDEAERVYRFYRDCAHQLPRRAYVEVHGNSRSANADEIQVATPEGFSPQLAQAIKDRWVEVRPEPLAGLSLLIEPVDEIYWSAGGTKREGMMRDCPSLCLHFELPASMRDVDVLDDTADVLAQLLAPFLEQ